jgi:hypothetical protein
MQTRASSSLSTAERWEKGAPIFHEGPGYARQDYQARDRIENCGPEKFPAVRRRSLGDGISDLREGDCEKHAGKMLDRVKTEHTVFHGSGEISQRRAGDGTNGVEDESENKLQIKERCEDQSRRLIFFGPFCAPEEPAPDARQRPETGNYYDPTEEAMSVFKKQVRHSLKAEVRRQKEEEK